MFFIFYRFCFLLRNCKGQDSVFILRMDVILRNVFAYIKASAHAAGITLTPYIVVLLVFFVFFVLVETLGSCYCQESFLTYPAPFNGKCMVDFQNKCIFGGQIRRTEYEKDNNSNRRFLFLRKKYNGQRPCPRSRIHLH